MNAYLVRKYSYAPAQRRRTTMVLDGQRMGDERDWVLVGFFVTCSSSAEKRFIRPAKQDEMGLWHHRRHHQKIASNQNLSALIAANQRRHCSKKKIEQSLTKDSAVLSAKYTPISSTTDRNHARLHIWKNHASDRHKFGRQDRPQGPDSTGGRRIRLLHVIER